MNRWAILERPLRDLEGGPRITRQPRKQASRCGDGFGKDFEVEACVWGMGVGVGQAGANQERVGAENLLEPESGSSNHGIHSAAQPQPKVERVLRTRSPSCYHGQIAFGERDPPIHKILAGEQDFER
jgi:hypothetical protein